MSFNNVNVNGNIFNNVTTTANQASEEIMLDARLGKTVTIFGTSSVAGNLKVSYSVDGINFIDSAKTIAVPVGAFESTFDTAVKYVKVVVDVATTITATLAQSQK